MILKNVSDILYRYILNVDYYYYNILFIFKKYEYMYK